MSILEKSWKYINEGNAHIVLQVLGTNYVLRLIKEDGNPVNLTMIRRSVNFVNLVMIPLLSITDHHLQDIVQIPADGLLELSKKIDEFRPEHRKHKNVVSSYAIKDINLAFLNTKSDSNFCIELKPKEGFMSPRFKEFSKCYYCLKQFLKMHKQQIDQMSDYCPLDLYSGDKNRMKRALISLIKNPQNNFKIFQNGQIIYDERSNHNILVDIIKDMDVFQNSLSTFLEFIIEILLHSNENHTVCLKESEGMPVEQTIESRRTHCSRESSLETTTLLYKLLSLQRLSEDFNFGTENSSTKITNDKDFEYVHTILDHVKTKNLDLKITENRETFLSTIDANTKALISAVAKDCSIMISFSTTYEEGFPTIQIGEHKIPYRISITDLEPKPLKTLAKKVKTEKKLTELYEQYLKSSQK